MGYLGGDRNSEAFYNPGNGRWREGSVVRATDAPVENPAPTGQLKATFKSSSKGSNSLLYALGAQTFQRANTYTG